MLGIFGFLWDWILPFVAVLSVLVFVHELGHYLVARWCRVRVEAFSIGFGPQLTGWDDKAGTRWKICAFPLGGYVKMFGEQDFADDDEQPAMTEAEKAVSFHHKTLRQRVAIVTAGPAANFLFAIVLFAGMFVTVGVATHLPVVGEVQADSAAAAAGFAVGDRILSIDGEPVANFEDLRRLVSERPDMATAIEVRRGEETMQLTATPQATTVARAEGAERRIGILGIKADPSAVDYQRYGPIQAVTAAVGQVFAISAQIMVALWEIISGTRTAAELGGPLRIAQLSGEVAQHGFGNLLRFTAALSINLGLINLFPIPMLDGGHLAFYAAEAVRGRPLGRRIQEYGFRFGLAVVLLLIIFVTWNDLMSLNVFDFVRQLIS